MKSEGHLQAEVCKLLQSKGIYFFSVPNEAGGRSKVMQMQLVSMGLKSGVSDLVVLTPPTVLFLEIKTEDGKQSENQEKFQKRVESLGYAYKIARSLEDVEIILGETK